MYTEIRSIQILLSLLKAFAIKEIVLSPGGSDIPLIHSIETDDFFNCYSVVDERSAAYFAMGVAQQKNRPCACVCTSGTAVCNYIPGITEAYYQSVPVLAITADKNPCYQDQLEIQKIKQDNIFAGVIKKAVELPLIKDAEDEWLCNRLVNEALLELTHHGTGPVHINLPVVGRTDIYDCKILPKERKITIHNVELVDWKNISSRLSQKKILIVVGQNILFSQEDIKIYDKFFEMFNCVYAVENISNLSCKGTIRSYPITEMHRVSDLTHLAPDIIISIGNNLAAYQLKPLLRRLYKEEENWLIWEKGKVRDAYKCLTDVFECSPSAFFNHIIQNESFEDVNHSYYELWLKELDAIVLPDFSFSNFYIAQQLSKAIPYNSILHMAILNSTRVMQFFELAEGVKCYSNVGALGIDGCFSTFAGQAAATKELAFLLIGDLSFFYDMNAAGLRSISSNVRVVLLNNGGGSEFHFFMGKKVIPTIDSFICAEHDKVAAGWIKSLGYEYYLATNKEELEIALNIMRKTSEKPIFLEVVTDMEEDAIKTNAFYDDYRKKINTTDGLKSIIRSVVSEKQIKKAKEVIRILRER